MPQVSFPLTETYRNTLFSDRKKILVMAPRPFGLAGCYMKKARPELFFCNIPPIFLETWFCLLMIYAAWKAYKTDSGSALLSLIIRDRQVLFFSLE